jgi:HEAT repeat protein
MMRGLVLLAVALSLLQSLASAQEPAASPTFSEEQIAKWKTALKSTDIDLKCQAVWALGLARETSAVAEIALIFNETRWELWGAAAWALGNIKSEDALQALVVRASEPKYGRYVGLALGEHGAPAAVLPLIAMLKSSDEDSRGAGAAALGRAKDARAIEPLLPLLDDRAIFTAVSYNSVQWNPQKARVVAEVMLSGVAVRSAALDALVQINDRRALAPVEAKLASEPDDKFRGALSAAVDKLRTAPMPKSPVKRKPG